MNSQQIIKTKNIKIDELKFNSVTKNLIFQDQQKNPEVDKMREIIRHWYENKIKTDGFDGSLEVKVKIIEINKVKQVDYFKITIDLTIEFNEIPDNLISNKTYNVSITEFGEILGSFSINDQENLTLNIMHQSLKSITQKILELN